VRSLRALVNAVVQRCSLAGTGSWLGGARGEDSTKGSGYTPSFNSFAGRNAIFLLAAISMDSPIAGFRPIRAGSARTCRMPRPVTRILSPFARCFVAIVTRSVSTAVVTLFDRLWPSANSAAICLSVMVTCGAAFTATAFFPGTAAFFAGAAAFFDEAVFFAGPAILAAGAVAFLAVEAVFFAGGMMMSFKGFVTN
jgi:hypothetical protein